MRDGRLRTCTARWARLSERAHLAAAGLSIETLGVIRASLATLPHLDLHRARFRRGCPLFLSMQRYNERNGVVGMAKADLAAPLAHRDPASFPER